jgi:DNA-binding MarR family transcriptional regulator
MSKPPRIGEIHEAIDCLGRLSEIFRQRRQELAAGVGLTEQQWSVLDEIENEHFMPSMFARRRESSPAAVSKILRQLQDKELVYVSVDASDGRQRNYVLSPHGKRTLGELRARRQHAIEHVWQQFDTGTLESFTRFGNELIGSLERYSSEASGHPHDGAESPGAKSAAASAASGGARKHVRGSRNGKDAVRQGV